MSPILPLLATAGLILGAAAPAVAQRGIGAAPAQSSGKLALVIGNGDYPSSPLRNPTNDARDMAVALQELGFTVIHAQNASQEQMKRAIRDFGAELRRAEVGLFYFAGHGIQAMGRNFLIPVDAEITSEPEVEYESVDLGFVMAQMEAAGSPLNIVILDACRNNPFARAFRSASRGLTQVSAPTGTLIAYATAPGNVASDGTGENGLYTQELLRFMRTPGLTAEEVFKQVRISLIEQSGGEQTPWESSSLTGNFYFRGPPEPVQVVQAATPAQSAVVPSSAPDGAAGERETPTLPPAPTPGDLDGAVQTCLQVLESGDTGLFDRLYASDANPVPRHTVRQWVEKATSPAATRGTDLPGGFRLADGGLSASLAIQARLTWRSAFGARRSAELPIEAALGWTAGRWQFSACRVAGDAGALR